MYNFDYDLRYIQHGLGALEVYLTSKSLYWPMSMTMPLNAPPYPQLTPGNLLLYFARCQGGKVNQHLNVQQLSIFTRLEINMQTHLEKWRANWEQKAIQEYKTRLRNWANYLNDLTGDQGENSYFATEVRNRALLELLRQTLPEGEVAKLGDLEVFDNHLRSKFHPGEFVWEMQFEGGFPNNQFWFLYGKVN